MTRTEKIITKAIDKAIANGWKYKEYMFEYKYPNFKKTWTDNIIVAKTRSSPAVSINYLELFFDHDFAKALWGEHQVIDWLQTDAGYYVQFEGWQWKLMHMIIAEEPLKYLGENI